MDIIIPDYLNKEFFTNILARDLCKNAVNIKSLSLSPGSSGGDNYCSFIYRAKIDYTVDRSSQEQKVSFIIKSMPTNGSRSLFAAMNIYEKETHMYLDIIPKIDEILSANGIGPKHYYSVSNPVKTVVMEDLTMREYTIADRVRGFDEQHAALVLKRMGEFHAASMIVVKKNPKFLTDIYTKGLYNSLSLSSGLFHLIFQDNFLHIAEVTKQFPGFENIAEKLNKLENQFLVRAVECTRSYRNHMQVINHGDLWVNNFLFKYENQNIHKPTDIKFIDFQGSFYGSPGLDINYFLNTSLELDILINRKDILIENHYYQSFRSVLEKEHFPNIPTLEQILLEIRLNEYFGFFTAISIFPYLSMERGASENNSIENFDNPDIARRTRSMACSSKRFQDALKYSLKRWDGMGIFD